MNNTKIEWTDCTVNPVVGCTYGCPFCYARRLNQRFGWVEDFAKPQFFPERLKQLDSKKLKVIFMDSMSDIADWKQTWLNETIKAIKKNPQHFYLFLTKRLADVYEPSREEIAEFEKNYSFMNDVFYRRIKNVLIGRTVTTQKMLLSNDEECYPSHFLSIEPILEKITLSEQDGIFVTCDWVIIGAETGNRKGKVIPKREWVESIVNECREHKIPVFMKGSLKNIWGEPLIQEFPKSFNKEGKNEL